jgi:vacuolar protein sorting-associated protein 16
VYLAILHIHKTKPFAQFVQLIKDKPLACNLYIAYAKQKDLGLLREFNHALQRAGEVANVAVLEAYQSESFKDRMKGLHVALPFYAKEAKVNPLPHSMTEEQMALLTLEAQWEQQTPSASYVDLSVSELLQQAIKEGAIERAMKIKKAFGVPDKRFWHVEVRTLARAKAWEELAKLVSAKGKVPPIGYLPFVEACVEMKNYHEAARYIQQLSDPHEAMEWLCNIGYWKEAADIAAREKDVDALQLIRSRCRQDPVIKFIDQVLSKLAAS